jgi:pilus assembly protein CpaE
MRSRPAANDNVVRLAAVEPLQLTAEYVIPEEVEEAPFLPPPADDILGVNECEDEEETIFVSELPPVVLEAAVIEEEVAVEEELVLEDDAPFDPPEFDDEPVFSAPASIAKPIAVPAPRLEEPKALQPIEAPRERPVPAISIYASWDRPEAEALLKDFAADPRLARAEIQLARGGLDGAIAYCETRESPDLLVLDTNIQGKAMLEGLDRLRAAAPRMRTVVLGSVNDIGLLRDLAARGVSDYIVPPAAAADLVRSACQLFHDAAPARVIAVIGARGGVGASTIARNLAFSIAERQHLRTALVDLDFSFGSVAASFEQRSELSVMDVVEADDADEVLTRATLAATPRLKLLAAPQTVASIELDEEAFGAALAQVRRIAPNVVLDLPHAWEPWVRRALREADEVVVVAGPDLASLRNADNMLKLLRSERDKPSAPLVVLSMTGVPKRPEIPLKDYAQALCVQPEVSFAFEPELFGKAEAGNQMIFETMPDSKAALQLDALATSLTGREPIAKPAPRERRAQEEAKPSAPPETAEPAKTTLEQEAKSAETPPVLELTVEAPPSAPQPRRRRVARTGFVALQEPPPSKSRRSRGLVRTALAAVALVLAGAWFEVQHAERAGGARPAPTITFRA